MSLLFASGGQGIGASASATVLPVNPGSYATLFFMALDFTSPPGTSTAKRHSCFGPGASFLLAQVIAFHFSPVEHIGHLPTWGTLSSGVRSFCPFMLSMGFSKQEYWSWVAVSLSSGPRFVRSLHYDPSILPGSAWHNS